MCIYILEYMFLENFSVTKCKVKGVMSNAELEYRVCLSKLVTDVLYSMEIFYFILLRSFVLYSIFDIQAIFNTLFHIYYNV